ncbi:MAG TPA: NUDIX domain-containing protein [Terriglobia bacterium]|nr:NUDIX domain-containing protein [Terriglobia bacterium]
MPKISAGLIMYRKQKGRVEVLLVHPGGPFWARKDAGAWSIPKGEVNSGENELATAQREFEEEIGLPPKGPFLPVGEVQLKSGKVVRAWAFEGSLDPSTIRSNTFRMEWPPRSGRLQDFPEIDLAGFFSIEEAKEKINPAQIALLETLMEKISCSPDT